MSDITPYAIVTYVVLYLVGVVVPLIVLYYVIKFAVLNALREHHDDREGEA
jgi:hypothetical protein